MSNNDSNNNKARKRSDDDDDDDGLESSDNHAFGDEEDDSSSSDDDDDKKAAQPPAKKKQRLTKNFIDDAAEESGDEENDSDDDEDENDDNKDYERDGFVVDETEKIEKIHKDDLSDSDDDDDDDDDDDNGSDNDGKRKKIRKFRKVKDTDRLDDDDMLLIKEAQKEAEPEQPPQKLVAKSAEQLESQLFDGDDDDDDNQLQQQSRKVQIEQYDEEDDGFIVDDIGDQAEIRRSDYQTEDTVNEAQLNEASEIFGTDYLEFMQDDAPEDEDDLFEQKKYSEDGVGVSLAMDSDEEVLSDSEDEDEDLFGDDNVDSAQKSEVLKLKREKRKLQKLEKKRLYLAKRAAQRKLQLRRNFEPVQLIENFCTERDDAIREADVPERFFDKKTPKVESGKALAQAGWICQQIPALQVALAHLATEERRHELLQSIVMALQYMHDDALEPAFIKRYRKDTVPNLVVQEHLYDIMDQDNEWHRMVGAKQKVEQLLNDIHQSVHMDRTLGADAQKLQALNAELEDAQTKLDETAKQESQVKIELQAVSGDNDDDDELFGDDEDHDSDKKKEKTRLESHLATIQSLLEARADKVSQLQTKIQRLEEENKARNDPGPMERILAKISRASLWNASDYQVYLELLDEARAILDMNGYLKLIQEGNDAIRKKELPGVGKDDSGKGKNRRSRRFDRDFYRTCVSNGLRKIAYSYLLSPLRVGKKLEGFARDGHFDYSTTFSDQEETSEPSQWMPNVIESDPTTFANTLVGSGELVLLDASSGKDPLRGCRYVAAMELAHEPRVRKFVRDAYRRQVVLSTQPTKKGRDNIDAFHDYYGIHLIKAKPVAEHFPLKESDAEVRRAGLSPAEAREFDAEMTKRVKESCLQYLNVLKAESTGDIIVHVHLPLLEQREDWFKIKPENVFARTNQDLSPILTDLLRVYAPAEEDTREWMEERQKVLDLALTTFLLPVFEMEVRRDLREAASKMGISEAALNLKEKAAEGPYRPAAMLHTQNRFLEPTGDLPIVGVCCSSDSKEASYLASVTETGEQNDYLAIPPGLRVDSDKMRDKVILFLLQSRPSAIVVGTSGGFETRNMQRKMTELLGEALRQWNNRYIQGEDEDDDAFEARHSRLRGFENSDHYHDEEEEEWKCNVELVDDSVAQLFGRSVRSKKEFPDFDVNLKCAISVARFAKDPLAEYTYAWSVASDAGVFGTEMLYMNIHPLQQLLPKNMLLRQYERILCEVVADVGADVNACCAHDHLRGLLMFVPGLGPRKAANLKQLVAQLGGSVSRRRDLLEKRLMGPKVYNNAVAFLKIRPDGQLEEQFLHPLDETRLHPDVYYRNNWAVKIAFDALEREDPKQKEGAQIKALTDIMNNSKDEVDRLYKATKFEWEQKYGPTFNIQDWDPAVNVPSDQWNDKVDDLDLEAFANIIEKKGNGKWLSHFEMIKWEFRLPFADPRRPMKPLTGDVLFHLISGETDQSLRPGKEVTGKVLRNGDFGSRVKLEGDIPAFIRLRDLSDDHVESAEDYVAAGQVVTAVVTEVKKDHMSVDMSLKLGDFRKKPSSWMRPDSLPPIDPHFDMSAATMMEDDNEKRRDAHIEALQISLGTKSADESTLKRSRVVRRACTHPAFMNARHDEVDRLLKEGGATMVGEAMIRPSTKNSDSLAIHWVVREGSIKVIEAIEEDKETDTSIGNVLKIKGEAYESIDELLGRHIAPMNDYVEEVSHHRKFLDMPEDEVDEKLKAMKQKNPASIPYAVCFLEMHPGYMSLRFVGSTTARGHLIGITPNGFSWDGTVFPSLDHLINEFKKNPRGKAKTRTLSPKPSETNKPPPPKGRWGSKPASGPPQAPPPEWNRPPAAPLPPMVAPPARPQPLPVAAWGQPQDPPAGGGWGQQGPPRRPPPPNLPPPPAYGGPPPQLSRPPPPRPPPQQQPPPLPPRGAFESAGPVQGRGRGRNLPAWMTNK